METLNQLWTSLILDASWSTALGWTLIHSIWQISLIGIVMSLLHTQLKKTSQRYFISASAMVASLLASIVTFVYYYFQTSNSSDALNPTLPAQTTSFWTTTNPDHILNTLSGFIAQNIDAINTIWFLGLAIFLMKFLFSYLYIQHLKTSATPIEITELQKLLQSTKRNLNITKNIILASTDKINVPIVLGHLKPMVLFPIGMVTLLSTEEIEGILLHELAHIKRNDYLINMIATLVETIFFYHPIMWWISANVKSERENHCDDIAMQHFTSPIAYAKTLVKLQEFKNISAPALSMPLTNNKHQLLNRIKRILNMKQSKNDIKEKSIATVLLLAVVLLFSTNLISKSSDNSEESLVAELVSLDEPETILPRVISPKSIFKNKVIIQNDTLPKVKKESKVVIKSIEDEKEIELEKSNGKITKLKIDGREIPENEYEEYGNIIKEYDDVTVLRFGDNEHVMEFDFDFDERFNDSMLAYRFEIEDENWENIAEQWESFGEQWEEAAEQLARRFEDEEMLQEMRIFKLEDMEEMQEEYGERMEEFFEKHAEIFEDQDFDIIFKNLPNAEIFEWKPEHGNKNHFFKHNSSRTLADQIGDELNEDGLLKPRESNKVELTGKHLKINGDKMPKPLYEKYKRIYEERTGTALTKKSKMIFEFIGEPSERTIRGI